MTPDWLFYISAFVGPFVQEDAAILGATTAFLHPDTRIMANGTLVLGAMFAGLVISDLWKYWLGFGARKHGWTHKIRQQDGVIAIGNKILAHPGKTLLFARFVPGTRIPAYLAAGFFGVPFRVFAFWVVASGAAYVGVAIAVLSSVGAVAGKNGQLFVAVGLVCTLFIFGLTQMRKREIPH
jgi:membrane protein DedA with SNARE-associated domain